MSFDCSVQKIPAAILKGHKKIGLYRVGGGDRGAAAVYEVARAQVCVSVLGGGLYMKYEKWGKGRGGALYSVFSICVPSIMRKNGCFVNTACLRVA